MTLHNLMNKTLVISAISLIAVMMIVGVVSPAIAKEGNNGNNGCEKSGNARSCEANPNSPIITCQDCMDKYHEELALGNPNAISNLHACNDYVESIDPDAHCQDVTPGGF